MHERRCELLHLAASGSRLRNAAQNAIDDHCPIHQIVLGTVWVSVQFAVEALYVTPVHRGIRHLSNLAEGGTAAQATNSSMWPSTITPASPSATWLVHTTPGSAPRSGEFSPTMAPVIATGASRRRSARPASNTDSPGLTPRAPTARQNASSKPHSGNGYTQGPIKTPSKEKSNSNNGSTTTTSTARMLASTSTRPSADQV